VRTFQEVSYVTRSIVSRKGKITFLPPSRENIYCSGRIHSSITYNQVLSRPHFFIGKFSENSGADLPDSYTQISSSQRFQREISFPHKEVPIIHHQTIASGDTNNPVGINCKLGISFTWYLYSSPVANERESIISSFPLPEIMRVYLRGGIGENIHDLIQVLL
jgi:hypothetical protein